METWHDFFVAVAGAAAALTGLIFVGVSLSLSKIINTKLPDRASEALILLMAVLIISCLCLAPQSSILLGTEILVMGALAWFVLLKLDLSILRATDKEYKHHYMRMIVLTQLATLSYVISGIVTLVCGYKGIYWIIPAVTLSFGKSVLDAWVILVEIHR
ncbi:MAG: hypothetical protein ACXVNO_03845 [Bacteroidia bacterium]